MSKRPSARAEALAAIEQAARRLSYDGYKDIPQQLREAAAVLSGKRKAQRHGQEGERTADA